MIQRFRSFAEATKQTGLATLQGCALGQCRLLCKDPDQPRNPASLCRSQPPFEGVLQHRWVWFVFIALVVPKSLALADNVPFKKPSLVATLPDSGIVQFSPDGKTLAVAGKALTLWEIDGWRRRAAFTLPEATFDRTLAFSPDIMKILHAGGTREVYALDLRSGKHTARYENPAEVLSLAVSPNGNILACGCSTGTVQLWDLATGQKLAALTSDMLISSVVFSPNGKFLATLSSAFPGSDQPVGRASIWDVANRTLWKTFSDRRNFFCSVAFSPDNRSFALGSSDCTIGLYNQTDAGRQTSRQVALWAPEHLVFSRAASVLAVGGGIENWPRVTLNAGEVKFWDVRRQTLLFTLQAHDDHLDWMSLSPNGTFLAVSCRDRSTRIWNVASFMGAGVR
jgi:WD40 repeat protein